MKKPKPAKAHFDAVSWTPQEKAVTRVRIRRLITTKSHGAKLMLGVCVMDPGEETNLWSSAPTKDVGEGDHWYGPVEETYYCIRGQLKLTWDEGTIDFGPDDAVYLAPGWHYRLKNTGTTEAYFVYNMFPAQE